MFYVLFFYVLYIFLKSIFSCSFLCSRRVNFDHNHLHELLNAAGIVSCLYYSGISLYLVSGIVRVEVLFVTAKGVFSVLKRVSCFH